MSVTLTLEADRIKCPHCEAILEDGVELERRYECGTCGQTSEERRCDSCNLFMARMEGGACPECDEVIEDPDSERVPVITCGCHDEEHEVIV